MQPQNPITNILSHKLYIGIFLLVLFFIFAIVHVVFVFQARSNKDALQKSIEVIPLGEEYVPNQLIVQFHEGYAPEVLEKEVKRREALKESFFGNIKLFFENAKLWYTAEERPEITLSYINEALKDKGVTSYEATVSEPVTESLGLIYLFTFDKSVNIEDAQDNLSSLFFISSIEPNIVFSIFQDPNDPLYSQLWGLQRIALPQAWDITTGSDSILVGVIDSGIDINHPEFSGKLVGGYDFVRNDSIPEDELGHGTHVAGTVGAIGDNALGIVGVNWNVKIIPLKVCNSSGKCLLNVVANAINSGLLDGARVFNMSFGGKAPCTPSLQNAIDSANTQGAVMVAAAGNTNENADSFSPGNCQNVVTVGATDSSDRRSIWNASQTSASNFGSVIEVAAPGSAILSTMPGGVYSSKDGTSMASPHVAGAAALLYAVNPALSPQQVTDCITQNADAISTDMPIGGKRLNVSRMLSVCKDLAPQGTTPEITPDTSPSPEVTITPPASPIVTTTPPAVTPSISPVTPPITTPIVAPIAPPPPPPPVIIPSPQPGEQYYTCSYDPSCNQNTNVIQLCPLVCTPISGTGN